MTKFYYAVIISFIILLNVFLSYANIPEIVLNQKRAVVTVYVNDKDGKHISTGSGFIIGSNGIIVTNYHVISKFVEGKNTLLVKMENGAFFPLTKIVNYDKENDIAVFKVDGKELPTVNLARSYKPKQGESIVVIGSPLGLETTVSDGIISSVRGKDGIIQITAPISPGSSGSPVFNSKGEVVGVATFLIEGGQNLNFSIPVRHVEDLLKGNRQPKKKGFVDSEQHPAVAPAPSYKGLTAEDWYNKAEPLWKGGKNTDPTRVIEYLNNAIKLKPDYAIAYHNRGATYAALDQHQRALEDFSEAIRLKPDYAIAYHNRGNAYSFLGRYQRAIQDFNEAIRLKLNSAETYYSRGLAYSSLDQYQSAIEDYNEAIRLQPDKAEFYRNRGAAYYGLNHYRRAIEDYNEAILMRPDLASTYGNRAAAYFMQDNNKMGCRDAQKACDLGDCSNLKLAKTTGYCR